MALDQGLLGPRALSIDAALAQAEVLFDGAVALLRWPEQRRERDALARVGAPRLLLVEADGPAPRGVDLLEDWLRAPVDRAELVARRTELARRSTCEHHGPVLDDDGLLWWDERWVAIPEGQVPVVRLLVDRVRDLVRLDELAAAYAEGGGSTDAVAVKAMLGRLIRRCAEVGVAVRSVRGKGYVLDAPNPCPLHGSAAADAKDSKR
jgi:hypothetical protein